MKFATLLFKKVLLPLGLAAAASAAVAVIRKSTHGVGFKQR